MTSVSDPLIQALLTSLHQHLPQLHGKRIWLACSGGRDSLSLAVLCRQLFDEGRLPFLPQLLHVNHGMQASNATWAAQVEKWANNNHMSCQVLKIEQEVKTEQSARQARYDAMMSAMNSDDVLMLGHHRDDQVETVLMRLFNGAGANGLSGMAEFSSKTHLYKSTASYSDNAINNNDTNKTVYLWRPWLKVSRAQITQYAKANNLPYIDDPTNVADLKNGNNQSEFVNSAENTLKINDRAWLRGVLMPAITERYPQAVEAIARTSQHMANAAHIINEQVEKELSHLIINSPTLNGIGDMHSVLSIKGLLNLSSAMQFAVIHTWLQPNNAELPPSTQLVSDVLQLCQRSDSDHQTCLYWNSGLYQYEIRRYQQRLYRLRVEWLDWLSKTPEPSEIQIKNLNSSASCRNHVLKKVSEFTWQITGLSNIFELLGKDESLSLQDNGQMESHSNLLLRFEPLSREIKLTLAGRQGGKSGKKLLQAINQPTFMRDSVVLCSLIEKREDAPKEQNNVSNVPLFIISTDGIYPVKSELSDEIINLVNNHQLVTEVVYSNTDQAISTSNTVKDI